MSKKFNFSDQWRIRLENGRIKGPFPIESVRKMIVEGIITGQEDVAQLLEIKSGEQIYSDWKNLTKQPEFYEAILESLENPVERDEKKAQKMDAETVVQEAVASEKQSEDLSSPELEQDTDVESSIVQSLRADIKRLAEKEMALKKNPLLKNSNQNLPSQEFIEAQRSAATESLLQARDQQLTIEMNQLKKIQINQWKKFYPLFVGLVLLVVVTVFLLNIETEKQIGWVLIAPNKKKIESGKTQVLSAEELKTLKAKAIQLVKQGRLESTRDSQKFLVQAVEGAPNDIETLGLLCVVYQQLWPYTKQNSADFKAVTIVTQMSRSLNPISSYADTCQAVYLLTKGQPREASGLIEKTLDQKSEERFILTPFLYFIKGELFEEVQNYINASAFYDEAIKTFPGWNWVLFAKARTLYKQTNYNEAKNIYAQILKNSANSKAALFGLGLVENKLQDTSAQFKNQALNYFSQGFIIDDKLPKPFHLEALLQYIELLLKSGDRKKALDVAQFGLTISPSHKGLKDVVISLGGEEKNNNASSELVFLGDQFARSGDHLAAQAQYKAAFEFDKTNASIALKAAKSLWTLNQSREALIWVDRAIQADRKLAVAYSLKADYLSQKFNFVEAAKVLQDATKSVGQGFEIYKAQALVEFRKNNMVTAATYGEKAYKLYDADVELLTLMANANINLYLNSPSRNTEEEAAKSKYLENAQRYASRAVDLEPGWPEAQITYSKYLYIKPNTGGAITAQNNLNKLIEIFPYTFEYRIGLAEFYELQEKYKSASEIYYQLTEQDPKNKKALMGYARTKQLTNEITTAQNYYLKAAVLDPSDVEPLFATAQLELDNPGKESEAVIRSAYKKFEIVKTVNPNYPRISYYLARCLLELGEFDKAIAMTNDEKKKNPGIADPYILAASVYYAKNQFKDCASEYSQAIKLRPNSADLYVRAAVCYRKSDDIELATDMLALAYEKESGNPEIYRERGYIQDLTGRRNEAKQNFLRYLDLSPNAIDRKQIELKLGN